ncbi:hypothetical protein V6N12_049789 [Hibiscus sabdariffa]|uniref:Uncharacterized protein n=1 Tax=Hibiscus sabdariffa TaxID=183260 RepID=A0ABR2GAJ6_9ROSI
MQELNKFMEARLVKLDERRSTYVMDNMPIETEIPRQEVGEQCKENPLISTLDARDATKSNASASSTVSDVENDTISLMLKHEPVKCSHPQLSRQLHGYIFKQKACSSSTKRICPSSIERICPSSTERTYPGSTERIHLGSTKRTCSCNKQIFCPGSKHTFCLGGEQNDSRDSNCLNYKMTDCSENEAHFMVISPTICVAPKSLLMEMFKKSEDNDTWKLNDFKKDVPSIDFHIILAEDCHGNWLEQQLPQHKRLHPTMMEVNENEVIKWLDVVIIFPNHIFRFSRTIARWSVYMNFKGKKKEERKTSTMAAQREVVEIPLAQVFLGRIVTRWRVRMDYKKYRKRPTFLD